jgi:hypothetical protein
MLLRKLVLDIIIILLDSIFCSLLSYLSINLIYIYIYIYIFIYLYVSYGSRLKDQANTKHDNHHWYIFLLPMYE